jgi:O-succinylbenzoic acid--CoA ligase
MSESTAQAATLVAAGDDWNDGDVGELLAGLDCRIGSDGRLALRGATVMLGYLNPELRPGVGLVDGWFLSSDLGRIAGERRISIVGRADDMLVSGGVNVHPLEIESLLAACPGVADLAVTARGDPVWGDLIVAIFVGDAPPDAVQAYARAHLASAQRPRRFLRVARLPRNAMGKIERTALRALAGETA